MNPINFTPQHPGPHKFDPKTTQVSQLMRAKVTPESKVAYDPEKIDSFTASAKPNDSSSSLKVTEDEQIAYTKRNASQVKKNPGLEFVLQDPKGFFSIMESRFEQQKALTPKDPYQFDYSEVGMPLVNDLKGLVEEEITTLKNKVIRQEKKSFGQKLVSRHSAKEYQKGIVFLNDIQKELEGHTEKGSINYRDTQKLAYHSAKALGAFDREDLGFFDSNFLRLDRYLLGHQVKPIDQLHDEYKNGADNLFDKKAGDAGIELASKAFEKGFYNPEQLQLTSIPVARELGPGVFMRLLPHDIYVMGVANEPAAADGFVRPGSDFYLHDLRHSGSIYTKRKVYEQQHGLGKAQIDKLAMKSDVWMQEFAQARKEVSDKSMRYAIGFLSFNLHHDRGIPQLPSSYIPETPDKVTEKLYFALKASKQPTGFDQPRETINKAYQWLRNFWLDRLPQEEAITKSLPANQDEAFLANNS